MYGVAVETSLENFKKSVATVRDYFWVAVNDWEAAAIVSDDLLAK